MADDARGRFLNRLFRRLRFFAEWQRNLFTAVCDGPDHRRGSRCAAPFPLRPHLHHHTDFLLELYAVLARTHGRAGHNQGQYKHSAVVFRDLRICSRTVPVAAVALETRSDFARLAPAGGFAMALLVAGIEERVFVIKYRDTGVGPTPRWTVGTHWLAYDRDTGRLYGSD